MNNTVNQSSQFLHSQLKEAYRAEPEQLGGVQQAPPIAELLYLCCVGVFTFVALVATWK